MEHQMYNASHFFELAVAHNQLTGDPKVLNAAMRRRLERIDGGCELASLMGKGTTATFKLPLQKVPDEVR